MICEKKKINSLIYWCSALLCYDNNANIAYRFGTYQHGHHQECNYGSVPVEYLNILISILNVELHNITKNLRFYS